MSKRLAVTVLSVGIAALVGVLVWTISTKGGWFGSFWSGASWARGPERSVKTFNADPKDIDAVTASFASEDVIVRKWDGNTIHVEQFSNADLSEQQLMRIRQDGSRLVVESGIHGIIWFGPMAHTRIEILIPKDLQDLSVSTASGEAVVESVTAGKIDASSASGNVQAVSVQTQDISCASTSGDVYVQTQQCDSLTAATTSGSINVETNVSQDASFASVSGDVSMIGAAGSLSAGTTSGDIYCELQKIERFEGESTSGTISVNISNTSSLKYLNADTTSGDVWIEVPSQTAASIDFTSVSGEMRTDTGNGGIELRDTGIPITVGTTSGDFVISAV